MDFVKKNIHMDKVRCQAGSQISIEDDINISDSKPDADKLVFEKGEILSEEIKLSPDHVHVKGKLHFEILYVTEAERPILTRMEGNIPFEEHLYLEGAENKDNVTVKWCLEDLTVGLINSRKLSVQALADVTLCIRELQDEEAVIDAPRENGMEYRKQPITLLQQQVLKHDIHRLRDEVELPGSYPNIYRVLWDDIALEHVEFRPMEDKISLQGELRVFFLYEGEAEEGKSYSYETTLPFNGMIDCQGSQEKMVADIQYVVPHRNVEVKTDYDGEERVFAIECVMELSISLMEEENLNVLWDMYGIGRHVDMTKEEGELRSLLAKTTGKTKVTSRIRKKSTDPGILQLLHSEGAVQMEDSSTAVTISPEKQTITIQGIMPVKLLYQGNHEKFPYTCLKEDIPFSYEMEVPGITQDSMVTCQAGIEQWAANMIDGEEFEIKAVLTFNCLVTNRKKVNLLRGVQVSDSSPELEEKMPGMVIYFVKDGDTLWDIGKEYGVSLQNLRDQNAMSSDTVKRGDKILIMKELAESI